MHPGACVRAALGTKAALHPARRARRRWHSAQPRRARGAAGNAGVGVGVCLCEGWGGGRTRREARCALACLGSDETLRRSTTGVIPLRVVRWCNPHKMMRSALAARMAFGGRAISVVAASLGNA
eukprot:364873-Chlamydomonas_euryale.AAC.1